MICKTLEEATALMSNPLGIDFNAHASDPAGTVIGTYKGEPVEVEGYSCKEFYKISCLKFFGTNDPLSNLEPFKGFR